MTELSKISVKFSGIKGKMIARAFLETMGNDLFIQNELKHVFTVNSTFAKYTEVLEIYRRVIKLTIPYEKRWEELYELLY